MAASDVAKELRLWAVRNNLMAREQLGPHPDAALQAAMAAGIQPVPAALPKLPKGFGISFVGFNEASNEVIVYTTNLVRKKLQELLPSQAPGGVTISYQVGTPELIGKLPPNPFGTQPAEIQAGRYMCGGSIHVGNRLGAGTMGCLVRDAQGELYGLSNNHVSGNCNYASPGLPIVAPGSVDVAAGGVDPFCIGHHYHAARMVHGTPDNPLIDPPRNMDAAIFKIADPARVTSKQKDNSYDTPDAVGPVVPGMTVTKVGRTTGRTAGIVRAQISGPFPVRYKMTELEIDMAVFYEPVFAVEANAGGVFALPGDSGALVTTLDANNVRRAIGLVVAGDTTKPSVSFILPLEPILQSFGVTIVSGHNV